MMTYRKLSQVRWARFQEQHVFELFLEYSFIFDMGSKDEEEKAHNGQKS